MINLKQSDTDTSLLMTWSISWELARKKSWWGSWIRKRQIRLWLKRRGTIQRNSSMKTSSYSTRTSPSLARWSRIHNTRSPPLDQLKALPSKAKTPRLKHPSLLLKSFLTFLMRRILMNRSSRQVDATLSLWLHLSWMTRFEFNLKLKSKTSALSARRAKRCTKNNSCARSATSRKWLTRESRLIVRWNVSRASLV